MQLDFVLRNFGGRLVQAVELAESHFPKKQDCVVVLEVVGYRPRVVLSETWSV